MIRGQKYKVTYIDFTGINAYNTISGYYLGMHSAIFDNLSVYVGIKESIYDSDGILIILNSIAHIEKVGKTHFHRLQQIDGTIESKIRFYLTMWRPELFGPGKPVSVSGVQDFMNLCKNSTGEHTISI